MTNLISFRTVVASLVLTGLHTGFSSNFLFPGVEYSYAKLYLFNVVGDDFTEAPDGDIYNAEGYAPSKIGDGFDISKNSLETISSALATGANELLLGLSGCYIPRHGIIYFDKTNKPVASLSICAECDRISLWNGKQMEPQAVDEKHFNDKKAESQMAQIESAISAENIPLFEKGTEYVDFVNAMPELFDHLGSMNFQYEVTDPRYSFPGGVTIGLVKKWLDLHLKSYIESTDVKIAGGGTKYSFTKLTRNDSWFLFNSTADDALLSEAVIDDPLLELPWGVRIGMSLSEVQDTFPIWDGISNPERITIECGKLNIGYEFARRTLTRITVRNY